MNAAPTVRIAGVPLAPRTTRKAHGDNGPVLSLPVGNEGYKWRCARDPVVGPDGSVTGTATTSASDTGAGSGSDPIAVQETMSTGPGRWACSVQALSGDNGDNELRGTPWVTTPTVTVRGEFVRDQTRTALKRLAHGRLRLTIPAIKTDAAAAAHGKVTVTISHATCASVRRGTFRLHKVLTRSVALNADGRGSIPTSTSPRQPGFYLGASPSAGPRSSCPGAMRTCTWARSHRPTRAPSRA